MIHGVAGSRFCITLQGDLWLRIRDSSHVPNGKFNSDVGQSRITYVSCISILRMYLFTASNAN